MDDTYMSMEEEPLYIHHDPKLERDSILIIHAHEGAPIAEFIKKNVEIFNDRFKIEVSICDIDEVESRTLNYQVTILLITPEVISHLKEITDTPCPSLRFSKNTTCAFLVHDSVNFYDENIETVLKSKIPGFHDWTVLKIGSLRSTVLDIVSLLDQTSTDLFPATLQYRLEPNFIMTDKTLVYIMFKNKKEKGSSVVVHVNRRNIEAKYLNPYTYSFSPNGLPYGRNSVNVFVDGKSEGTTCLMIGNKMDFLYKEIEDMTSPVEFLCQVLRLSAEDRESLDRELGDRINHNVISNFSFLNELDERFSWREQQIDKEFPTMLHFGAKFGLDCFCQVLMKVPGFGIAQTIRNKDGQTPSQLAKTTGFHRLSYELDPSNNMLSNTSLLGDFHCSISGPPVYSKSKQRSQSESTSHEDMEVTRRPQTERAKIQKNRKESVYLKFSM
ncbi:uncharacterized protein LOC133190698 [Saccostrea echinata]|uniref:uncharacterized protein LOC133190698 n=1 Tax=Saccostrea echinata TaxID=191078 RepID=UPI002A82E985|nr:uncharacterized protein LOC133190698 [Saccostrea echinata]